MPQPTPTPAPRWLRALSPLAAAAALLASVPAQAVTYSEVGDAGLSPGSAQQTVAPAGPLTNIFGSLGSSIDADVFVIRISNPATFSASTVNAGSSVDTQLFLFTLAGAPLFGNDDAPGGATFQSLLPAGTAASLAPGLYLLGISLSGHEPVNSISQLLFDNSGLSTDVRGPAASLQPPLLSTFDGGGFGSGGSYDIQLTGAVAAIPEPASALLFALGGAALLAARRRAGTSQTQPAALA